MRRILPALLVVSSATLICGFFVLEPPDYRKLGLSALSISTFSSNIYFWRSVDYFAEAAPESPLLHTWSLGVEEQFYLLMPLFLLVLANASASLRVACVVVVMIGSLSLGILWTGSHSAAAFYLLPTRAWELLLGGVVAMVARKPLSIMAAEALSILGLAAIASSAILFSRATPYPGIAAVVPSAGAAAVILSCASQTTASATPLRSRALVATGLISYSLYLWHWPVLTFARYYLDRNLGRSESFVALSGIVLLAYVTWRYIEKPFRSASMLPSPRAWWWTVAAGLAGVLALGSAVVLAGGFPGRLPAAARIYVSAAGDTPPDTSRCHHGPSEVVTIEQLCTFGGTSSDSSAVLVWGDSHANALMPALKLLAEKHGARLVQASYSSCPPILGADVAHTPTSHACREFNDTVLDAVAKLGVGRAILVGYWSVYLEPSDESQFAASFDIYSSRKGLAGPSSSQNEAVFESGLLKTVHALESRGVRVWVVGQVPSYTRFVPNTVARMVTSGRDPSSAGMPLSAYRQSQKIANEVFAMLPPTVRIIDPAEALCRRGICIPAAGGRSFYIDNNHLSTHGAMSLRDVLEPIFH